MMASDSLLESLRDLLDPAKATDERVVSGCEYLHKVLEDQEVLQLARLLVCAHTDIEDALREVLQDRIADEVDPSVRLAALRFRVKAVPFAKELCDQTDREKAVVKRSDEYKVPQTFAESNDMDRAIEECFISPEASDPLQDMAFLIEVQKRRLIQQLKEIGQAPTAFLMNKQFNATVESLKSLIKEMAKLQVDFGLRRHVPKQIELRVQNAFNTFVSSIGDEKDAVEEFSNSILSILEEDVVDAEFSEKKSDE
jgi:hypothetical protein